MTRLATWLTEWAETIRVAPPFSRRRRELVAILADVSAARLCDHDWQDRTIIVGRVMPRCDRCGTTRWVREIHE